MKFLNIKEMQQRIKLIINWIRSGHFKRIELCGIFEKVVLFPDISSFQVAHSFPDLKVKIAEFSKNELDEKQFCDSFSDVGNKYVNNFSGIA